MIGLRKRREPAARGLRPSRPALPAAGPACYLRALLMIRRLRFHITAIVACHLLLTPRLFTSQLPHAATHFGGFAAEEPETQAQPAVQAAPEQGEEVLIRSREQEKSGSVFRLRGEAEITFRDLVFRADEITYDAASGEITASGNVLFEGGPRDERIQASRARYNVQTDTGEFFDVTGSTGVRFAGKNVTLTTSSPFRFTGRRVEKTGRHNGRSDPPVNRKYQDGSKQPKAGRQRMERRRA